MRPPCLPRGFKIFPTSGRRYSEPREFATSHYSIAHIEPERGLKTFFLNLRWSTYFHIFYFFCAFFYLIPLFININFTSLQSSELSSSIRSQVFACIMSSMISLSLPLLLDLGLDVVHRESAHYICRSLLSITLILPPLVSLQSQFQNIETVFLCFYHWQHTVWTGISLSLMYKGDKLSFTPLVCLIIIIVEIASAVCNIIGYHLNQHAFNLAYVILLHIYFAIGVAAILRYFFALYSRQKKQFQQQRFADVMRTLTSAEYSCLVVAIATLIAWIGTFLLQFIVAGNIVYTADMSSAYLLGYYSFWSTFGVIITIVPSRGFKALSQRLRANLEVKRTFVRHVGHEIRTPLNTGKHRI